MHHRSFILSVFLLAITFSIPTFADTQTVTLGAVTSYFTQRNVNLTTIPYVTDASGTRIPFSFCTNNTYFAQNANFDPIKQINVAPGTYTWKFSQVSDGACNTVFVTKSFTLKSGDSLTFQPVLRSTNATSTQFVLDEGKTSSNIITTPASEVILFRNSISSTLITAVCVNENILQVTNSILKVENADYKLQGISNGVCTGPVINLHVDAEKYYIIDTIIQTTVSSSSSNSSSKVNNPSSSISSSQSITSTTSNIIIPATINTKSTASVLAFSVSSDTKNLATTGIELPLWIMLAIFGSSLTSLCYLIYRSK